MKLTGLQIFKYLPGGKKEPEANCKKCGFPTCMAFAMKLPKGEATIEQCEYVTDELKQLFEESSQPQQEEVTFGPPENPVKVGNETVMYRHDKKFVNPTCLAIRLDSSDANFDAKLEKIKNYSVERVGETLKIDAVALFDTDETFIQKAEKVAEHKIPLILMSEKIDEETLARFNAPTIVSGSTVEELINKSQTALDKGIKNIVLHLNNISPENLISSLTQIRKAAIVDKFRPLGFPVITFQKDVKGLSSDPIEQGILGSVLICKYSNIIVLDDLDEAIMYALLTLRQNIYTDPEKPLQIEPGVYPISEPDENAPVFVTTNFALTYFSVAGEVEASNIPSYIVITPSDGMSVLTAWSADKLNGEIIAKTIKNYKIEELVKHRKLIIPGYVAVLKEEIEEELPNWEVIIGTNEAVDIVEFLKQYRAQYVI
ncbi:MAG: hypothetical protein A2Y25_10370 [Candidatus Melainabacteria bacterium GWF2_37_15]|nr:MAG: hypothetical protein A2Y25_10370 [Candidatus Melainabacteria bacterium GWF2_37_15]